MHLVDAVGHSNRLQYVCNLHEQAVSIATEAYAQYTGNLGVGLVTTGPGGTNAITGIAAAWVESTPCVILSGQVKRDDLIGDSGLRQLGMQEIDIISIVRPITKYAETILDPQKIKYHLEKAWFTAQNGRPGPVWLDIPLDVQAAYIDETKLTGFPSTMRSVVDVENIDLSTVVSEATRMLKESERPCILVGNGVRLSKAMGKFQQLVDLMKIPVLTTWKTIDFFDNNHPLYFGRPGSLGQRGANFIQQNCDLLLVLGARLDAGQTGYNHEHFAPKAKKIVVDIDPHETKKLKMNNMLTVNTDVGVFIDRLSESMKDAELFNIDDWIAYCRSANHRYPIVHSKYYEETDYVNPYVLIDQICEYIDENAIVVPGSSGMCSEITMQAFRVKKGQRILNNQGFGAMGFGLPASIGVCLAADKHPVVCINGDGGFQLNIQELETVSRLNLPIKYFILNNQGYGAITNTQRNYFGGYYVASESSSGLTLPDICKVALAYNIPTRRIHNHAELLQHIESVLQQPGPFVCDVMIDPMQIAQPRMSSMKLEDGTMISKPLEDLWPFLDRDEWASNMLD